jgi:hypothetical protein
LDDRRRDGGANFILRIKEQETRLILQEHDDDDDDDREDRGSMSRRNFGADILHGVMTVKCFCASEAKSVLTEKLKLPRPAARRGTAL